MLVPDTLVTEVPLSSINSPLEIFKTRKAKILVVDDEEDIIEVISYNLEKEGYHVVRALSGEEAIDKVAAERPDLVILDLMLPGIDGLEVCKKLKQNQDYLSIPIVMLSARGDEADIVAGLELGASDYITKPFSQRILSARLKSVLKRGSGITVPSDQIYEFQGISIHPGRHEVRIDGELADLTASEFRLLDLLIRKPGWVFTRTQIVDAVRGEDCAVTARSVDVQVVGLRRKLGNKADLIETVRGVGYRVKEEISSLSLYLAG
jgi:two-component system alkaline phosphatase synthesis response regulator PhoP